ncbi:MAG: hypothetical protein HYZ71_11485 [Deltaproteobacteria bacterium]|nr:hypothetical protein [Deltaproteobacteria bacterium]
MKQIYVFLVFFGSQLFAQQLVIHFDKNQFPLQDEVAQGVTYKRFKGANHHQNAGQPEIPRIHKWVAIDATKTYSVKIESMNESQLSEQVMLFPAQKDALERAKPQFEIDAQFYKKDAWMGSDVVRAGKKTRLGALTILPLEITPVAYNPAKRQMRIVTDLTINITPVGKSTQEVLIRQRGGMTRFVREQADVLVENASAITANASVRENPKALVITTSDLLPLAKKLVQLQESVSIATKFEVVANGATPEDIKKVIQDQYNADPMDAVVLFGSAKHITLYNWDSNPGDVYYSLLQGDDNVADVALGRIPVSTEEEANQLLEKTRKYMMNLASGKARTNVMLIAHSEDYPGKYTANQEEIYKADNPLKFNFTRQYGGDKATNETLLKSFPNNFGIINYRGHGDVGEFWAWGQDDKSFTESEVNQLNNDDKDMAIYFNIACNTGDITASSKSLAESMLFRPAQKPYEAAVAVVASTQPSYTETNHRFDKYLFESMGQNPKAKLGAIYAMANNRLVKEENGEMPENVKMYLLLGNPLLPMPYDVN